jgi:hypothetical protein
MQTTYIHHGLLWDLPDPKKNGQIIPIPTVTKKAEVLFEQANNILPFMMEYVMSCNSPGKNKCPRPSWISQTNRTTGWVISHAGMSQMGHPMNYHGPNTIVPKTPPIKKPKRLIPY